MGTSSPISTCYASSAVLLPSKLQHSLKGMLKKHVSDRHNQPRLPCRRSAA